MKNNSENTQKRAYCVPLVEQVKLDNEISLALESNPPMFPGESLLNAPVFFDMEPIIMGEFK